jgi:hypothetical protein
LREAGAEGKSELNIGIATLKLYSREAHGQHRSGVESRPCPLFQASDSTMFDG